MKRASKTAFGSGYGFQSNGFVVDEFGNITANAITTISEDPSVLSDFTVSTNDGNTYIGLSSPTVLVRSTTYVFEINLVDNLRFAIIDEDQTTLYNSGVRYSDGSIGENAQNKSNGRLVFTVPATAPDTLYYGDTVRGIVGGSFQLINPAGVFSSLTVNETANFNTIVVSEISNDSEIVLRVNNGTIATINSTGVEFASGTITNTPTENTHITNKQYVDLKSTALAIALGS